MRKSVRIRSYSGPHFPTFGVQILEKADQNNCEYGHCSRSVHHLCQHTLFGIRTLNMNKDGIFKASIQIQMELGVKIFKLKLLKMHGLTNVSITT